MAFTLWLSAEEERILERIMREEGSRDKQSAVIKAIREKGAQFATTVQSRETPAATGGSTLGNSLGTNDPQGS